MKSILLIIVLFLTEKVYSQPDLPIDSTTNNITFTNVISVEKKQKDLYANALLWIGETYTSPKTVIQIENAESGILILNPLFTKNNVEEKMRIEHVFEYNFKIFVKDNKVKYIVTDIMHKLKFPDYPRDNSDKSTPVEPLINSKSPTGNEIAGWLLKHFDSLCKSFEKYMLKKSESDF